MNNLQNSSDRSVLCNIASVAINEQETKYEKMVNYIKCLRIPYLYIDGEYEVEWGFANNGENLNDRMFSFANRISVFDDAGF